MIKWQEALEMILNRVKPAALAKVPIGDALGLVASETVVSPERLPGFDNSAMDGYAVRSEDCVGASEDDPVALRVLEELPAGAVARQALSHGAAIRIMTGAPLPLGCDAVIPVEKTRLVDGAVEILVASKPAWNIRFAGEDIDTGQAAIMEGEEIKPAHIGLLAALGVPEVSVIPPVKVAVITTGSELVDVSCQLCPGKIRDANLHSLSAQIRS
jgi:molybdopterin molybdotransferase